MGAWIAGLTRSETPVMLAKALPCEKASSQRETPLTSHSAVESEKRGLRGICYFRAGPEQRSPQGDASTSSALAEQTSASLKREGIHRQAPEYDNGMKQSAARAVAACAQGDI